jgi:3-hydroxyisobutyrate dehydrogenase-like beta-hydroxyacid dehydrogenase
MAHRLLDAGNEMVVVDARAAVVEPFLAKGARVATSAAALADEVDTVFLSLPTPAIVRTVALGEGGLKNGKALRTVIDLSTVGPDLAKECAAALPSVAWIDSPVSGGTAGAAAGKLAVMSSGARQAYDGVQPLLANLGKTFYVGTEPGMAQVVKLLNNLLSATALAITSEAMVMGTKAGIDPDVLIDVFNVGTGANSATQDKFPRRILPGKFDAGFATSLMYKDLRLCLQVAEDLGLTLNTATAVKQLWLETVNRIGANSDFTEIVKTVELDAGVEVRRRTA